MRRNVDIIHKMFLRLCGQEIVLSCACLRQHHPYRSLGSRTRWTTPEVMAVWQQHLREQER